MSAEEAYYNDTSGNFTIYVRNDGVGNVQIVRAYLTAPDGTVYFVNLSPSDYVISSGSTVRVEVPTTGISVTTGVWTIKLVADDGSSVAVTVKV